MLLNPRQLTKVNLTENAHPQWLRIAWLEITSTYSRMSQVVANCEIVFDLNNNMTPNCRDCKPREYMINIFKPMNCYKHNLWAIHFDLQKTFSGNRSLQGKWWILSTRPRVKFYVGNKYQILNLSNVSALYCYASNINVNTLEVYRKASRWTM